MCLFEKEDVNCDIKLLIFRQLSWRAYFPPLASQGNFSELVKEKIL